MCRTLSLGFPTNEMAREMYIPARYSKSKIKCVHNVPTSFRFNNPINIMKWPNVI